MQTTEAQPHPNQNTMTKTETQGEQFTQYKYWVHFQQSDDEGLTDLYYLFEKLEAYNF